VVIFSSENTLRRCVTREVSLERKTNLLYYWKAATPATTQKHITA
jgi:hypothetical protein